MEYSYFVNLGSWFFIAFTIGLAINSAVTAVVDWFNTEKRDVKGKLSLLYALNGLSKKMLSTRKLNKALKYKTMVDSFDTMTSALQSSVKTLVVVFGLLPFTVAAYHAAFPGLGTVWHWIMATVTFSLLSTLAMSPFDYYMDFHIEGKFGFNTQTTRAYIKDGIRGFLLGTVIAVGIQLFMAWVLGHIGKLTFGIVAEMVLVLFMFGKAVQWAFSALVLPMFNDFAPLKDRKLKRKLERLCSDCGFKVSSIVVMDQSRRSTHSNAFICGAFGRKKIVLFDTMLKTLTHDEIVAVVAHEIGHDKKHHLLLNNIQMVFALTVSTVVSLVLMKTPSFYTAFGYSWVNEANVAENYIIGINLASTFLEAFFWIFLPISNCISRWMEREADRYAVNAVGGGADLENALVKLSSENLADMFPHPLYEAINYSHPSLLGRIIDIKEAERQ